MKFILVIITILLASIISIGQTTSICNTRENTLYFGIDNPILAVVEGMKCDSIIVTTDNGVINGDTCYYSIQPSHIGKATIYTKMLEGNDTIILGQKIFRVKKIPAPTARISGMTSGVISKNLLAAQLGIKASLDNFDFDLHFIIASYSVVIMHGQDTIYIKQVIGQKFTNEMISKFQNLKKEDGVIFTDIKTICPWGDDFANDIFFKIE